MEFRAYYHSGTATKFIDGRGESRVRFDLF